MKKTLFVAAALVAVILGFGVKNSFADQYGCSGQYGQYGGCPPSESIMIDKTVGKANTDSTSIQYVDNLSPSDTKFNAGQYIYFQLKVKNTSNVTQYNVKVVDNVPSYIDPVEGPGTYDPNTRTVVFYIPQLNVNEEKLFTIKMQVKSQDQVNADSNGVCALNKASATADNAYDEDTAQFCVNKTTTTTTVTGVTQVPSTGANDWMPLTASVAALAAGIYLKKKAKFN